MVYSNYTKLRILHYQGKGYKPYAISYLLKKEDCISDSRYGIAKFLEVYFSTDSISRRPGSGRASKVTRWCSWNTDLAFTTLLLHTTRWCS